MKRETIGKIIMILSMILIFILILMIYLDLQAKQNSKPIEVPKYQIIQVIDCIEEVCNDDYPCFDYYTTITYESDVALSTEFEIGLCNSAWEKLND